MKPGYITAHDPPSTMLEALWEPLCAARSTFTDAQWDDIATVMAWLTESLQEPTMDTPPSTEFTPDVHVWIFDYSDGGVYRVKLPPTIATKGKNDSGVIETWIFEALGFKDSEVNWMASEQTYPRTEEDL